MKLLVLGLLIFGLALSGCVQYGASPSPSAAATGRVVYTIADVAANLSDVTNVKITVTEASAHSTTQGWVTLSSMPKTYDLLELKGSGKQVLIADAHLPAGTYEQVRLAISNVVVTDSNGDHSAKLPSGVLRIVGGFNVSGNTTSTVKFDFVTDESLHVTGQGEYIMAPVVKVQSRENAEARVGANDEVEVSGGTVKTDMKVGMDIDGNVGVGLGIGRDQELRIEDGRVKIGAAAVVG